jgi:hypothetical protein
MTRTELAEFACKLLALWAFTQAALYGSGVLLMIVIAVSGVFRSRGFQWQDLVEAAVTGVPALGSIVVGVFLWHGASRLASKMVPSDPALVTQPDVSRESL